MALPFSLGTNEIRILRDELKDIDPFKRGSIRQEAEIHLSCFNQLARIFNRKVQQTQIDFGEAFIPPPKKVCPPDVEPWILTRPREPVLTVPAPLEPLLHAPARHDAGWRRLPMRDRGLSFPSSYPNQERLFGAHCTLFLSALELLSSQTTSDSYHAPSPFLPSHVRSWHSYSLDILYKFLCKTG